MPTSVLQPTPRPAAVLADALPGALARDLALVGAGAGLTALLAQVAIAVPPSPVPITGQTLAAIVVGGSLGARRGSAALLLYLLLGLALPVYADGGSGLATVTGPSGGYLLGLVLAAGLTGWMAERGGDRRVLRAFAVFVVGQLAVFGIGVPWLMVATGEDVGWAVHNGFVIFLVGGLVKAALAAVLVPAAWRAVRRVDGDSPT